MRITPLDVRKQEFSKGMRGFDCDEVRAFLSTLADEYETVLIDNKQIRERVMGQDEKIAEYKTMERTLRDTLMTAERVMQETRETASREGGVIIQEAQLKAKTILEECRLRTEELRREINGLRKEKETYLARFRGLAQAQIKFIDTHESDFEDLDNRLVDIVDNVVISTTSQHKQAAPVVNANIPMAAGLMPVTTEVTGPEVAPPPPPAPVISDNDVWRDYDPNPSAPAPAPAPATAPAKPEEEAAGSIADIVSESLSETDLDEEKSVVPVEAINIDVITNGQDETAEQTDHQDEVVTETVNI